MITYSNFFYQFSWNIFLQQLDSNKSHVFAFMSNQLKMHRSWLCCAWNSSSSDFSQMCVFSCPLEITPAKWIASSLLLLPPEAPVSTQGLMSHLLCMWNPLSETLASSQFYSFFLQIVAQSAPSLYCLESTFLACCWPSVLSLLSVPLLTMIDDFQVPLSSPSWGHTQPNLCSVPLICSAGVSVCLFILWFAFQPHKLPISWMETVATWLSLLYFHCIVLFSGMTEQLKASSPTVISPWEFSLGRWLSRPLP